MPAQLTRVPSGATARSDQVNQVIDHLNGGASIAVGSAAARDAITSPNPGDKFLVLEEGAEYVYTGTKWIDPNSSYTIPLDSRAVVQALTSGFTASRVTGGQPIWYNLQYPQANSGDLRFYWQMNAPRNAPSSGSIEVVLQWHNGSQTATGGIRWIADWVQIPLGAGVTENLTANYRSIGAQTVQISAADSNRGLRQAVFTASNQTVLPTAGLPFAVRIRRDTAHAGDTLGATQWFRQAMVTVRPT